MTNVTVPLLAFVDTTIAGHLGRPTYLAAIAVGGLLFNMAYWLFGFLRAATGGLTAQAHGKRDNAEIAASLLRSLLVGGVIGGLLILFSELWLAGALRLIPAAPEVAAIATSYFRILIWGAPAVLGLYSLTGWLLGMQDARSPMIVSVVQNVVNIVLSVILVTLFDLKIEGIAFGTLAAQWTGFALALYYGLKRYPRRVVTKSDMLARGGFVRFFHVSGDIFLRTLCLIAVTTAFTSAGAEMGEITLAANTLLMQCFILFSYVMDGFAYAGEAVGGHFVGAGRRNEFIALTRRLFLWGAALTAAFTLAYLLGGRFLFGLLTDEATVLAMANELLPYAVAIPLAGAWAFLFDGLFIGATATREMLVSMVVSTVCFFLIRLTGTTDNETLWLAFLSYLLLRGAVEAACLPRIIKRISQKIQS